MLAMTGTLRLGERRVVEALFRRVRSYQTVQVSESQRIVLIPPIGSFLVDWDETAVRLHVAANSQRDIDELLEQLTQELCGGAEPLQIDWTVSSSVPVPFR